MLSVGENQTGGDYISLFLQPCWTSLTVSTATEAEGENQLGRAG